MTATAPKATETVLAECSDDEEYDRLGFTFGNCWSPYPADVAGLYEAYSKNKTVEFTWKCPGRRNPAEQEKADSKNVEPIAAAKSEPEATDFDFEEESTPFMRRVPGKAVPLKTSAKKKTTSLTGILANMERHRIMDQMASDDTSATTTTTASSTSTTSPASATTAASPAVSTTSATTPPPAPTGTAGTAAVAIPTTASTSTTTATSVQPQSTEETTQ